MRLKAGIWVQAYIRQCDRQGIALVVQRHGDDDAGAVFIKVSLLNGQAMLFGPAPPDGLFDTAPQRWISQFDEELADEQTVDQFLQSQMKFDPDLWILVLEDRSGRHCLDDWLVRKRNWPEL